MPRLLTLRRIVVPLIVLAATAVPARAVAQDETLARALKLDTSGQQDAAVAIYRQVLARTPRSFDAQYGIARALDLKGSYEEARQHFSEAIRLAPDDGSRDQALRMLGVSWTFVGDAKRATPFFEQVFNRRIAAHEFAGAAEVANELGRVLLELGDLDAGARWYRTGYQTARRQQGQFPGDVDLTELRWAHAQARLAVRRGRLAEARKEAAVVKSLVEKGTNPDQQVQYPYLAGYIAFYSKDYGRAIAELQRADQRDPFVLVLLAQAYEASGDAERARDYYRKVLGSSSHAVSNAFARPLARRKLGAR